MVSIIASEEQKPLEERLVHFAFQVMSRDSISAETESLNKLANQTTPHNDYPI